MTFSPQPLIFTFKLILRPHVLQGVYLEAVPVDIVSVAAQIQQEPHGKVPPGSIKKYPEQTCHCREDGLQHFGHRAELCCLAFGCCRGGQIFC